MIVAYAGTFEPYQGLDLLIRGFARARQSCPNSFLLMIGGTKEQVAQYRALAEACGLAEHSLFTGRLDPGTVKTALKRAAVLTSPRSAGTNTPLKVYEQLASGIPLVATRIRSHTQVLTEEVSFLVEPTIDGLADGLTRALTDQCARADKTAAALALYADKYSRSVYEEKMRRLLEVLR
jgi:glycosyltransferase involved in cell wall biosynthesis